MGMLCLCFCCIRFCVIFAVVSAVPGYTRGTECVISDGQEVVLDYTVVIWGVISSVFLVVAGYTSLRCFCVVGCAPLVVWGCVGGGVVVPGRGYTWVYSWLFRLACILGACLVYPLCVFPKQFTVGLPY
jgi:hypothetical protein